MFASFSLIMLAILIPLYATTMNTLRENTVRYNEQRLSEGVNSLDRELLRLMQLGETMYRDKDIRALSTLASDIVEPGMTEAYKLWRAMESFKEIGTIGAQYLTHYGMVFPNQIILTQNRMHLTAEEFYSLSVSAEEYPSCEDWLEHIRQVGSMYSLSGMKLQLEGVEDTCLIFAVPVPLNTRWGTFFYGIFTQSEIEELLLLPEQRGYSQLTLCTKNGDVLMETGDVDRDYVSICVSSSFFGLQAEMRIRESEFAQSLLTFKNRLFLSLGVYLAVTVVLSLLYARKNAGPINDIVQAVDAVTADWNLEVTKYEGGYGYINAFIEQADKKLKSNQLSLAKQDTLIRENLMSSMLRNSRGREASLAMFRQYYPEFPARYRLALICCWNMEYLSVLAYSDFQLRLQELARNYLPEVYIAHPAEDKLLIIQPDEEQQTLQARYENLYRAIDRQLGYEATILVSERSEELSALSDVYLRTCFYLNIQSRNVFFAETQSREMSRSEFACDSEKLREFLIEGDVASALSLLQESREALRRTGGVGEMEVQQVFYSYRGALLSIADTCLSASEKLPGYDANLDPDRNFERLAECVRRLYEALQTVKQKDADQFDERLTRWVNDNLANPDLSVALAMEELSVSSKTLQSVMRRATGMSFREYIIDRRMEKARKLLIYTQEPISEIMKECGYASLNAFYKSFKRTFLIPPNEMREKARGEEMPGETK